MSEQHDVSGEWEGDLKEVDDLEDGSVRRVTVPGGWLYQIAIHIFERENKLTELGDYEKKLGDRERDTKRWSNPVFVPHPKPPTV